MKFEFSCKLLNKRKSHNRNPELCVTRSEDKRVDIGNSAYNFRFYSASSVETDAKKVTDQKLCYKNSTILPTHEFHAN